VIHTSLRGVSAFALAAALVLAPAAAHANQPTDEPPVLRPAAAPLNNPLEPGTYPGDTVDGPVIVVFSNGAFTDPSEEDWDITTALLPSASEIRVTDGGDGSAGVWSSLLTGADVLVLPEGDNWAPGGTSAISDAALEVIRTWVSAGRLILGTGSYDHGDIVSELTGVDFTSEFGNNDSNGPWQRVSTDTSLPAELPNANYAGGLGDFSLYSVEQKAIITPIYQSLANDSLGIAAFAIGTGSYVYQAYDWFPDSEELGNGVRDAWNGALVLAAAGDLTPTPVVPEDDELAATGGELSSGLLLGGAALALAGVLALLVSRRRAQA
jgi:LPXTG-motif cell wall-anchored protein